MARALVAAAAAFAAAAAAACDRSPRARDRAQPIDSALAGRAAAARTGTVFVHRAGRPPPRTDRPWITFEDVTAGSGLEGFRLHAGSESPKNWLLESTGGGLCAADFDGDGDIDLCLIDGTGFSLRGEVVEADGAGTRLFRNDGGFRFVDVTATALPGVRGYMLGGAAADYDGDGDADLFLAGYDTWRLLRNRGDLTFEDAGPAAGLSFARYDCLTACAWGDVDGDGLLDLYVANYTDIERIVSYLRSKDPDDPRACVWVRGQKVYCGPRGLPARQDRLWIQRPDHTFADGADRLRQPARAAFQPVFCDFDDDGDLDCYVANDGTENSVLVNDGRGVLTDRGIETGAVTSLDFAPQASMGVAVADYDADGRLDVAVTNLVAEYNALYRNRTLAGGCPLFEDVGTRNHFSEAPQERICWGIGLVDFDHDSVLDAFVSAGHVYPEGAPGSERYRSFFMTNQVLRGLGPPTLAWEDVSDRSGPHLRDARLWRGAVFPDLDGDGDCDVVLTAQHAAPAVLRNDGGERRSWVRFDLRPRKGLPTPAGARIRIALPDGATRVADVQCGSSYASSDDPRVHFGLGAAERVARVEVRWPDGSRTKLTDVPARQVVVVRQGD